MFSDNDVFVKITNFVLKIGIPINYCQIDNESFLSGLMIDCGTLLIDKSRLGYIGDILHEAGHIALMRSDERSYLKGSLEGQSDSEATEMMVIAWTYAACLEIGIDPRIVFHPDGYKGGSESILENFGEGRFFGVPMLQYIGLTHERKIDQNSIIFPKMKAWLRA